MPSNDHSWNRHWEDFSNTMRLNPASAYRRSILGSMLRKSVDPEGTGRILDLGCGPGELIRHLSGTFPAARFVGIDFSEKALSQARAQAADAEFVSADLLSSDNPLLQRFKNWATHALCTEVLEHVDDPCAFLRNAKPYLSPGAELIITVPGGPMSAYDRHLGHQRHYSPRELRNLLTDAGFEQVRVWRHGFPFFNLYRLLVVLRGQKLVGEITLTSADKPLSRQLKFSMRAFGLLLRFCLRDAPLGWQLIASGRKPASLRPV